MSANTHSPATDNSSHCLHCAESVILQFDVISNKWGYTWILNELHLYT